MRSSVILAPESVCRVEHMAVKIPGGWEGTVFRDNVQCEVLQVEVKTHIDVEAIALE